MENNSYQIKCTLLEYFFKNGYYIGVVIFKVSYTNDNILHLTLLL